MSHSIIYLIKRKGKKRSYYFFECIQQDFNNIGEISPKEMIKFENATFRYIFFRRARLEIIHLGMGAGATMN